MTLSLYLNLAWQTAILTLIGYVAFWAFKKIRILYDSGKIIKVAFYTIVTLMLLIPAAYVYASSFLRAIYSILSAL